MKSIKLRREACGMKQIDVAQHFGVAQSAVSYWESDKGDLPCKLLPELAALFDCTIDELFAAAPDGTGVG